MTVQQWSTVAADNNSSPPTGAPEGMAAAAVNNTMREMMASVALEAQVGRVSYLNSISGTNTITADMDPELTAYSAGMLVKFTPAATNTSTAVTLSIDGLTALDILKDDGDALEVGDLVIGVPAVLVLDSGADDFILLNPQYNVTRLSSTPQNAQAANYTLVLTDAGKQIIHTSGAGAGDTFTIPANASVAYPLGTVVSFCNVDTNSVSIAITTDTMTLAGTTTTGTRTLAQNGIATAVKVGTTSWLISGTGLS